MAKLLTIHPGGQGSSKLLADMRARRYFIRVAPHETYPLMDSVASLNSALAGRYAIEREVGAGGMATVYLARDLRHDRHVALKLLNPELGAVLGVERFLSEIKVTANLQHPNLLPLFDSGEAGGLLFYVMPFVEGESLRARLEREKQLPIDQAIHIAVAVAAALDYAHRHGVIHRDLKPENILLHEGEPLVADFGIALAVSNAGGGRITQTGLSLGTPQYMSPEQATGDRAIDGRTDIYSLGAVLYEMLSGEPPHTGATAQAIIARLMTEDPRPLTLIRRNVPAHVEAAVARALEKMPADRFTTAEQFREALTNPRSTSPVTAAAARGRRPSRLARYAPWVVAGVSLALVAILAANRPSAAPASGHLTRFTMRLPGALEIEAQRAWVAVTPSGSHIVYVGGASGSSRLYARALNEDSSYAIPGTDAAVTASFSPDGEWILFRTIDGSIKKIAWRGGVPTLVAPGGNFPIWGAKGDIVYGSSIDNALWRIPPGGGAPKRLVLPDSANGRAEADYASFLPSGDAVLFTIFHAGEQSGRLGVVTLDGKVKPLDVAGAFPTYVSPGYIVFLSSPGEISIVPFDARKLEITGRPTPILDGVATRPGGLPIFAVSADGEVMAYLRGLLQSRFATVSSGGQTTPIPGDARQYRHQRISPDGKRIVVQISTNDGSHDIWVYDIAAGTLARLTFDGHSTDPIWSPDGKRIAFARSESAVSATDVFSVPADGSGKPELLVGGAGNQWPNDWTPDGRTFVFDELVTGSEMRIMAVTDGVRRELVAAPEFTARLGAVSPDGRWLAYTSNETNRVEVYIRPMAQGATGKWQVSTAGGTQPVWSHDGKTLYYRTGEDIIAAAIAATPTSVSVVNRRTFAPDRFMLENTINLAAMPDDKHLLVLVPAGDVGGVGVVVNSMDEIRQKLASARTK